MSVPKNLTQKLSNGTLGTVSRLVLSDTDAHIQPRQIRFKGWTVNVVQLTEPPKAVIVVPETVKHEQLPGLEANEVPVVPQTLHVKGRFASGVKYIRTQTPIWPAFAITIHKSQGKTLKRVVVDLAGNLGKNMPQLVYVALSRVRSVNDIAILRGCKYENINKPNPDLVAELERLRGLELNTFGDYSAYA